MSEQKSKEALRASILKTSKYAQTRIESIISAKMAHNDITAVQSHVLMFILHQQEEVYATDIQRKLNISGATVSGLLKKLRANGYITMEGCDTDERRRRIAPTEKALMHREEIHNCMSSIEDKAFKGFSADELDTLYQLLSRMAENIDNARKEEQR